MSSAIPFIFLALAAFALFGVPVDFIAPRAGVGRRWAIASLVLKGLLTLGFLGWFALLQMGAFEGWADLTTLAGLIVIAIPTLMLTAGIDIWLAVRTMRIDRAARLDAERPARKR